MGTVALILCVTHNKIFMGNRMYLNVCYNVKVNSYYEFITYISTTVIRIDDFLLFNTKICPWSVKPAHWIIRSPQPIRTQHKLLIKWSCWRVFPKGLPVGSDSCPAVFQRRTCVVSWCGALTNSRSANNGNELTQVGGVLSVVIRRSKCLFCKLGPNVSKFHTERYAFVVTVICTKCRMDFCKRLLFRLFIY